MIRFARTDRKFRELPTYAAERQSVAHAPRPPRWPLTATTVVEWYLAQPFRVRPHPLVFKVFSGPCRGASGSGWTGGGAGVGGGEGDPTRFSQRNHAPLPTVYVEIA